MIFLVTYRNYLENLSIHRYAEEAPALAEAKSTNPDPAVTALVIDTVSSLTDLGAKLMVDLYNAFLEEGEKPVTKFENRTIAKNRLTVKLEARFGNLEAVQPPPASADGKPTEGVINMAGKTARVKKTNGEARKRTSYKEGAKVELLVEENPKRKGSESAKRFSLYKNGMLLATALEKGITGADLKYDQDHKYIKVVNP